MPGSGVSGYAAISARVRAMYSDLLDAQDFARLSAAPDLPTLVTQLKSTAYGPYLEPLKDQEVTAQKVLHHLKGRLADVFNSVIHMAPQATRPLLLQLYRYYEVENLKAVLRGILSGATYDRIREVLFPFGEMSVLPAQAMLEAGSSIPAAVELLAGTVYEEPLSFAMKRYSAEQSLFSLEVALDLFYWRQLWQQAKRLTGTDRDQALRILGAWMDMNNLTWVIRYRVYHDLSEEELINYTLPFGFRVRDEDVRAVAAGADIASVVEGIYPGLKDVNALMAEPRRGLPELEVRLKRQLMEQCQAAFVGDPFHIGVPIAFLVLSDLEIQDLTVLVEAKSTGLPEGEYAPYLLRSLEPARA
jgi:V/A-type H+-transporting ATPase subunit C